MQALLGTRLAADINLGAQIVMLIGLWIGWYLARAGQIPKHANMQTAMVTANLFFIFFVMIPSFYQYVILGGTTGGIVAQLMLMHGMLGLLAQLSGVYLVLRMRTKIIPPRFRVRNFRLVMRATLGLWTVIFVLGIGIYYYRYLEAKPAATVSASLVQLQQGGALLVSEARELGAGAEGESFQAVKRAAERLVNLVEGKTGEHFGDLDGDGSIEDPGNGIGILLYVRAVTTAARDEATSALGQDVEVRLGELRDIALAVVQSRELRSAAQAARELIPLAERAQRDGIIPLLERAPPLVIVVLGDYAFSPQEVRLQRDTAVVWINLEPEVHTATADDEKFDSGDLDRGGIFSIRFSEAGTFPYYCIYHGDKGGVDMAGTLVVE